MFWMWVETWIMSVRNNFFYIFFFSCIYLFDSVFCFEDSFGWMEWSWGCIEVGNNLWAKTEDKPFSLPSHIHFFLTSVLFSSSPFFISLYFLPFYLSLLSPFALLSISLLFVTFPPLSLFLFALFHSYLFLLSPLISPLSLIFFSLCLSLSFPLPLIFFFSTCLLCILLSLSLYLFHLSLLNLFLKFKSLNFNSFKNKINWQMSL